MANFKSSIAYGYVGPGIQMPITNCAAGELMAVRGKVTVPSTLGINDIIDLCPLPPGCVPVDCILESDDIDSATTITMTVAIINATSDDIVASTNMITASTVGQAGGMVRANLVTGLRIASTQTKRNVGVKVVAAPTGVAGLVALTLFYRQAQSDE